MKTNTFITTIFTFCLVIFASASGISNPVNNFTGDNLKKNESKVVSTDANEVVSARTDNDFSYLRFDVNDYSNENAEIELPIISFDYLRFDVNNYVESNSSELLELPLDSNLDYLRFDVNKFVRNNSNDQDEMPVNEFNYLRFDVNNFILQETM